MVSVNTSNGIGNSTLIKVDRRVPHGSILGPILYIVYVNDFSANIDNCEKTCYADDTNMLLGSSDDKVLHEEAKLILEKCKTYFNTNKLVINHNKTTVVQFRKKSSHTELSQIFLSDTVLDVCDHAKFLSPYINSNLNCKHHIDKLCKKLLTALFALRVFKNKVKTPTLVLL
jgi:ribonuclease P/MRP protein subunit RPP40